MPSCLGHRDHLPRAPSEETVGKTRPLHTDLTPERGRGRSRTGGRSTSTSVGTCSLVGTVVLAVGPRLRVGVPWNKGSPTEGPGVESTSVWVSSGRTTAYEEELPLTPQTGVSLRPPTHGRRRRERADPREPVRGENPGDVSPPTLLATFFHPRLVCSLGVPRWGSVRGRICQSMNTGELIYILTKNLSEKEWLHIQGLQFLPRTHLRDTQGPCAWTSYLFTYSVRTNVHSAGAVSDVRVSGRRSDPKPEPLASVTEVSEFVNPATF